MAKRALALALAAATLGGWLAVRAPAAPLATFGNGIAVSATSAGSYHDPFLSFRYPASWHLRHSVVFPDGSTDLVWLTNTGLRHPCTFRQGRITGCGPLPPGGVVVNWELTGSWRPMPPWFGIARPGSCRTIGGDETILQTFWDAYIVQACIRGPGVTATERQVRAMIRSSRSRTPP